MRRNFIMALAALSLGACVEDTYDLDKDIDTSVTIGSSGITTPPITVEPITLDQILDLDDDSNVKALSATEADKYGLKEGDYVFQPKKAESSHSNVHVPNVKFSTNGELGRETQKFGNWEIPQKIFDYRDMLYLLPEDKKKEIEAIIEETLTKKIDKKFFIDFSTAGITGELRKLDQLTIDDTEITLQFGLTGAGYCSLTYQKGFTIQLPDAFVPDVERGKKLHNNDFDGYTFDEATHTLEFTENYTVGKDGDINLLITSIKVSDKDDANSLKIKYGGEDGKGGYNNDGTLTGKLDFEVHGTVRVDCSAPCTIDPEFSFKATTSPTINLKSITGIVDPSIDININDINVTGIPSNLDDAETNLDLRNPMIFITINNPTPFKVDLGQINMSSVKDGAKVANAQSNKIVINKGINHLVISPNNPQMTGWNHVQCAALSDIIKRIPDRVSVEIPDAKIVQESQDITLGSDYTVDTEYDIIAALALNKDSQIRYEETIDGINDKLSDIDEIGSVKVTIDYANTIPMLMQVNNSEIEVLNASGNKISDISVNVEGNVKSGSVAKPSEGTLSVTLTQNPNGKLSNLDGLKLVFRAKTDENAAGVTLNKGQALTIKKAQLTISGGVTLEL